MYIAEVHSAITSGCYICKSMAVDLTNVLCLGRSRIQPLCLSHCGRGTGLLTSVSLQAINGMETPSGRIGVLDRKSCLHATSMLRVEGMVSFARVTLELKCQNHM